MTANAAARRGTPWNGGALVLGWRPTSLARVVIHVGLRRHAGQTKAMPLGTIKLPAAEGATWLQWASLAVPVTLTPTPPLPAETPLPAALDHAPTWRVSVHEKQYGLLESRWYRPLASHWDRFATITSNDFLLLDLIARMSRVATQAGGRVELDPSRARAVVAGWDAAQRARDTAA